jgi:hypothetical protein
MRNRLPTLSRPGGRVRWRNPEQARAYGWEAVFGPSPFVVVRLVDHSAHGLATGLVLRTGVGEQEIPEVWLAPAEEPEDAAGGEPEPLIIRSNAAPAPRR